MLQRLPVGLVQVKAGNTSEYFLNEIRQTVHFFSSSKGNYKKVSGKFIKSVWISNHTKTDTIFMNSENSRTSEPHQQVLNLANNLILKSMIKILHYQILVSPMQEKY